MLEKTSLFHQSLREQKKLVEKLIEDSRMDINYYLMLILSSVIISLGLIIHNDVVVIAGAFVAPILSPILAFGIAVVTGHGQALWRSFKIIVQSVVVVMLVAYFSAFVFITLEGTAIDLAVVDRPYLIYFLIAVAAGMAVAIAWAIPHLSLTIPDMAVSLALLPAVAATGIGAVLGDVSVISSSARMFGLNLLGLTLASALVFSLLGYARTRKKESQILAQEKKKGDRGILPH